MLDSFFLLGDLPLNIETGVYNPIRIVLSYSVAAFASYTALLLAQELAEASGPTEKRLLHWGGAFAMGAGIWSMHFIGMLSYRMRMAVEYDPWLTLLSLLIAVGVAYIALQIVARDRLSTPEILAGGVLLGLGICGMHYTGMAAMKMDAHLRYIPSLFLLSVAIAVAASCAALWIAFTLARHRSPARYLYQFGSAFIMGAAICGMHYTGMAAAVFIPFADCRYDPNQNFDALTAVIAGITLAILGITVGLSSYRKAKTEFYLRDSETKLRAVIDHAVDGLITIDQQGIVEVFNPACERLFGYLAEEVIGRNVKMLMPEPYHGQHDTYLTRYLTTGDARIIGTAGREVTGRRRDGSTFPMDLSVSSFELRNGRHFSGIIRDITARKEAERRLEESAQRERLVIQNALDAIVTIDDEGRITEWNKQAEQCFGWPRHEAMGQMMVEMIVPPLYRAAHRKGMQRFLGEGVGEILGKRIELIAQNRRGAIFTVEMSVTPQKVRERYYFTAFIRDVTAQRRAETERDATIQALKQSNAELDDFGHIVSHDLKEPLRGLHNHASFLLEDFGDQLGETGARRLNRLIALSNGMQRLIDDLLYFSRLGRSEMAVQRTDPNQIVREVEEMLEVLLEQRQAKILVPQPMPAISCDKTRVTEVFRNLITNAVKYNDKQDPRIEVGSLSNAQDSKDSESCIFYVKDNGVGIAAEFHTEIFRMFKRLQSEGAKEEDGTGAGLTFVKKIVERHGGRIWLESEPGNGTTFYFTLPQPQESAADQDAAPVDLPGRAA